MVSAENETATKANCASAVESPRRISASSRRRTPITGTIDWIRPSAKARTNAKCPSSGVILQRSRYFFLRLLASAPIFSAHRQLRAAYSARHVWPALYLLRIRRQHQACLPQSRPALRETGPGQYPDKVPL